MGELADEYDGQVEFNVLPYPEDELAQKQLIRDYGWEAQLHGLLGIDESGKVVRNLPGHNFGKPQIEDVVEELLAEE